MSRIIYFNEEFHKYTDDINNVYTSTTTLIGKYENKFNVKEVARRCALAGQRGNLKYKGKTAKQLEEEWKITTELACAKGTKKHNLLETIVKQSTGYNLVGDDMFINDRLYTIDDLLVSHKFGKLKLDYFIKTGIRDKYPKIFNVIKILSEKGYNIYAEVGVYDETNLISGLIDLFFFNPDTLDFIIGDYKTNKSPIKFEAGYFEKDINGDITDTFKETNKFMKFPINHLPDSVGNHYTLQLSIYAYLAELFGLTCRGLILFHIRDKVLYIEDGVEVIEEIVEGLQIKYLKDEVKQLFNHHFLINSKDNVYQTKLI